MKTFEQWIEDRTRTGLGIYPPLYAVGQYPPLYFTPGSATAALALTTTHKKTVDEIMGKKKKRRHKKRKRKDK